MCQCLQCVLDKGEQQCEAYCWCKLAYWTYT